jgi:hypothetical protein
MSDVPAPIPFRFTKIVDRSLEITENGLASMTPIEKKARVRAVLNNPRKLPENWIKAYLERKPEQLAEDVLQVFDENFKLRRTIGHDRIVIAVLTSIITGLAWEGLKALVTLIR